MEDGQRLSAVPNVSSGPYCVLSLLIKNENKILKCCVVTRGSTQKKKKNHTKNTCFFIELSQFKVAAQELQFG